MKRLMLKTFEQQDRCDGRRLVSQRSRFARRRGLSLMMVMIAISLSIVMTISLLRRQTTTLQIARNVTRRDLARQAAQTGATIAFQKIHSVTWQGADVPLSGTIHRDAAGTASFTVDFLPLDARRIQPLPGDAGLYLILRSTGRWMSALGTGEVVVRQVEAVVKLQPRLPQRIIGPGDSATASDLMPNPGNYDAIQQYSLFAEKGEDSLILDPEDCISGKMWIKNKLLLYKDPRWSSTIRAAMLSSIGNRLSQPTGFVHPHPLAGEITFLRKPSASVRNDLQLLKTPWRQTNQKLSAPAVNFSGWSRYRLYAGGPLYSAQAVGFWLQNRTLRPSITNPLGIFYRNGSVSLHNNVVIQGTLVATGRITIHGENVQICAFNWLGENGVALVGNAANWPRLPAIVADKVEVDRSIRTVIEGAVIVKRTFRGAGGDFELRSGNNVNLIGTATSRPLRQPNSVVLLQQSVNLTSIDATGRYEIWLQNGQGGSWHSIVGIDIVNRKLTIQGEIRHDNAVPYRIRRSRLRFLDIRGPLCGDTYNFNRPPSWYTPNSILWGDLWSRWKIDNLRTPIAFHDWLADARHFPSASWSFPHTTYGLPLEPTFHLQNSTGIHTLWSPPLFQPFAGSVTDQQYAGYRWRVVSWRELP